MSIDTTSSTSLPGALDALHSTAQSRRAVGQRYDRTRTRWTDQSVYQFQRGTHELIMFLTAPTQRETRAINQGLTEFAVLIRGDVLVLLYRFGNAIPWRAALFSRRDRPLESTDLPPSAAIPGPHRRLNAILVDAGSGVIQAIRGVPLSLSFTDVLNRAIHDYAARPWPGDREYSTQIQALHRQYPTAADMVRDAIVRMRSKS